MAIKARPLNPTSGLKGWSVPNSENTRFIKGQISPSKDPVILQKAVNSRNKTIKKERLRIKYGVPQQTKMKLDPYKEPILKYKHERS